MQRTETDTTKAVGNWMSLASLPIGDYLLAYLLPQGAVRLGVVLVDAVALVCQHLFVFSYRRAEVGLLLFIARVWTLDGEGNISY